MATETIGTSGRDRSTITAWLANLGSGDEIGECYDDSVFGNGTADESLTIDQSGPTSITLRAASGEIHDGTAGTGVRIIKTSSATSVTISESCTIEGIEWDCNGQSGNGFALSNTTSPVSLQRVIIHGGDASSALQHAIVASADRVDVLNSLIYDWKRSGDPPNAPDALFIDNGAARPTNILNVTVFDVDRGGIDLRGNNSAQVCKNCISVGTSEDFYFGAAADHDYNISEDASADGTNSVTGVTSADLFVDDGAGTEDLHLASGASDAIDAGTDLGTTPTGVEVDINGRDRDAEADTWDIGAHEYVAAGGFNPAWARAGRSKSLFLGV